MRGGGWGGVGCICIYGVVTADCGFKEYNVLEKHESGSSIATRQVGFLMLHDVLKPKQWFLELQPVYPDQIIVAVNIFK